MGAFVAIRSDYSITANLKQAIAVFYFAEAGIEWAKQQIAQSVIYPPRPTDRMESFSSGAFSVAFLSSTPVGPLAAKIVIRSTGVSGTFAQVVQAQITKAYDLADAAIVLRGEEGSVGFGNSSFLVSGFDHDPVTGGAATRTKPRSAISVSSAPLQLQANAELAQLGTGNVLVGGSGTAISHSDLVPSDVVARLADDLCHASHAVPVTIPVAGTLSLGGQIWGTPSAPQLHCVEGLSGPGDIVVTEGLFSGAGILVVRNAALVANSTFRWEGLIIVTGANIEFRVTGEDNKDVYGAIIVNETTLNPAGSQPILTLQGAIKVLYSRSALNRAADLLPPSTVETLYASLPATITQDYWRSLNP
ncbi:MAG: hypothetical protein WCH75_08845 [Candidatus Binatia bacterium]